jgi:molybdopterin/thiamine biosynthesis adenylyltransferase
MPDERARRHGDEQTNPADPSGERFTLPAADPARTGDLRILQTQWATLVKHLLGDGEEHAALLFCGLRQTATSVSFLVRDAVLLGPDDYLDRGALHLSVAPTTLARAAKRARMADSGLVLVHSHPFPGRVTASQIDLQTEADLCRRVLTARTGKPAAALVVGPDGVDARIWTESGAGIFDTIRVIGDRIDIFTPTSYGVPAAGDAPGDMLTLKAKDDGRRLDETATARQELLWGTVGQRALSRARVVVVGAGGTGSHVATQLAHLRVGQLTLIDHDQVEISNLSRIVGLGPEDIGRAKVEALGDRLRRINPNAAITGIVASVLDVDPEVLTGADLIVCATDGHGSRSFLTDVCAQYYVPVVDLGVEVVPSDRFQAGGGVRVLRPGGGCLWCAQTLNPNLVREEYLSEHDRALEATRGYLRGHREPAASVIALNGVVASLAVMEICQLLVGMLGTARARLLYRSEQRAVTTTGMDRQPGCHVCGDAGIIGQGDATPMKTRWRKRPARGA